MNKIKKFVLDLLIRKVSIDCFYEFCKNGCRFLEEDSNKHKYYCHLEKTRKWFWNGWKKRIIFIIDEKDKNAINIKIFECEKKLKKEQKKKLKEKYKDFSDGFSDCMNGFPVQKNNKDYIEGYSKAKLL